ncbi:MAG: DUF3781 domain-containing protein [Defluviitaleaceae bacterium]|nr:DUF3781 domain-containing protein [Defluviitaleaceae bacterium]
MNLLDNLDKIRSTELGVVRVKKNLNLDDIDIIAWCKDKVCNADNIIKQGKNWYVYADNAIITINGSSFTIITAHKTKK